MLRQTHIDVIVRTEIDLGGTARTLAHDHVEPGAEVVQCRECRIGEVLTATSEFTGFESPRRLSQHHYVAATVAAGFEEYRIHGRFRSRAGGDRLNPLRAADFGTRTGVGIDRHHGVVGHVLRFVRRDRQTAPRQCPADPGGDHRLSGVRGRPGISRPYAVLTTP